MQPLNVGDIWERSTPLGDDFDRIRICGEVDYAGERENEWSICSATRDVSDVLQCSAASITDFCSRISSGDEQGEWVQADA